MIYLSRKWSKVVYGSLLSEPEWGVLARLVLVARKFGCNGTLLAHTASAGTLEHCFPPMEHFDTACTVRLFFCKHCVIPPVSSLSVSSLATGSSSINGE